MPGASFSIDQLVAVNAYNPDILPELEQYVREQVSQRTYNLDANLALLRFYQCEPRRVNMQILTNVAIKSLMALPAVDYNLCMFLIPEKLQQEEPLVTIATWAQLLETARFSDFWNEAARSRDLVESVPGFEEAIQNYAVHVLSISYRKVPRHVLAEAVNINGPSLDRFLEHQKSWSILEGGQDIELPKNEDNYPGFRRNIGDSIPLEQVARLFPILSQ